jgi:hypothetical protein
MPESIRTRVKDDSISWGFFRLRFEPAAAANRSTENGVIVILEGREARSSTFVGESPSAKSQFLNGYDAAPKPDKSCLHCAAFRLFFLFTMNSPKYLLPLTLSICLAAVATSFAQPPAAAPDATPAKPGAPTFQPGDNKALKGTEPVVRPADGKAIFGDDFESGVLNTKMWLLKEARGATITVDKDKAAHGTYSLHAHYPAGTGSGAWAFVATTLPASLKDHFYGRVYMYASNPPNFNHSVFFSGGSPGWPTANFLEIGDDTNNWKHSFKLDNRNLAVAGQTRGELNPKGGIIPQNRWFCLEWEFTDKPVTEITIWVDGKQDSDNYFDFHGQTSELTTGFAEFDIGFRSFGSAAVISKDVDIYYDDLAISDKPIGQLSPPPAPAAPVADAATAK